MSGRRVTARQYGVNTHKRLFNKYTWFSIVLIVITQHNHSMLYGRIQITGAE